MGERLERRHRHQPVGDRASHRQSAVDQDDAGRDLPHARHDLLGAVGRLCSEQLHAANAKGGQDGDRDADDANAAQPLQQRPPEKDAVWSIVEPDDHRCAGCRQARNGLEEGVRKIVPQLGIVGNVKRDCSEQGYGRPSHRRQEKGLAQGQAPGQPASCRMGQSRAAGESDHAADEKGPPVRIARESIDRHRQEHGRREREEHAACQVEDRTDVRRSPCARKVVSFTHRSALARPRSMGPARIASALRKAR